MPFEARSAAVPHFGNAVENRICLQNNEFSACINTAKSSENKLKK
jgi:hypothetical protein